MEQNEFDHKSVLKQIAGLARPVELIGPSVDDDMRRAINRYGADEVLAAAKKLCSNRRGRPKIDDWPELRPVILSEAREWLEGRDPIEARTANSIAEDIAGKNPGHDRSSTVKRIRRKLKSEPHGRRWQILVCAHRISEVEAYPFKQSIRALRELEKIDGYSPWGHKLEQASFDIREYEAKRGVPPPADLSLKEVEAIARQPLRPSKGMMSQMQSDYTASQGGLLSFARQQHDEKM